MRVPGKMVKQSTQLGSAERHGDIASRCKASLGGCKFALIRRSGGCFFDWALPRLDGRNTQVDAKARHRQSQTPESFEQCNVETVRKDNV